MKTYVCEGSGPGWSWHEVLPYPPHPAEAFLKATKPGRAARLADMPPMVTTPVGSTVVSPVPKAQQRPPLRSVTPRYQPQNTG
jgi:hypothetical protein